MRSLLIASLLVLAAGCSSTQKPDRGFARRATNWTQPKQPQPMLGGDRGEAERVAHGY